MSERSRRWQHTQRPREPGTPDRPSVPSTGHAQATERERSLAPRQGHGVDPGLRHVPLRTLKSLRAADGQGLRLCVSPRGLASCAGPRLAAACAHRVHPTKPTSGGRATRHSPGTDFSSVTVVELLRTARIPASRQSFNVDSSTKDVFFSGRGRNTAEVVSFMARVAHSLPV